MKKVKRRRNKAVTVRMNETEYADFQNKVEESGLSQQAYIISAIKDVSVIPSDQLAVMKEISATFASLEQQQRGMATNINQMARIANSRNYAPGIRVLEKISREIAGYRKDSEEIWQSIRSLIAQQKAMGQ